MVILTGITTVQPVVYRKHLWIVYREECLGLCDVTMFRRLTALFARRQFSGVSRRVLVRANPQQQQRCFSGSLWREKVVFRELRVDGVQSPQQQCFGGSLSREGCFGESCVGGSGRQSVSVARFALARRQFPGGEQCALQCWWLISWAPPQISHPEIRFRTSFVRAPRPTFIYILLIVCANNIKNSPKTKISKYTIYNLLTLLLYRYIE